MMEIARVGLFLDRNEAENRWRYGINTFNLYLGEILSHAGITYEWICNTDEVRNQDVDILYVVLAGENKETAETIKKFAENGGTVISFGGLHTLCKTLGYAKVKEVGAGYAQLPSSFGDDKALRFLHATPLIPRTDDSVSYNGIGEVRKDSPYGPSQGSVLQQFQIGKGSVDRWAVHVVEAIVGFQQGTRPIFEDGAPAADGSGKINDGVLKRDDGFEMDWEIDRVATETGQKYFPNPYGDVWRHALIHHLLKKANEKGLTLPFTGYWPDGITCVAMLSHDSDGNEIEHAESTLKLLSELEINTTWLIFKRGYDQETHRKIKEAGHELGFHFNARTEEEGHWDGDDFDIQFKVCKEITEQDKVISNKNHYTIFKGWGELYTWCERNGIESDQSNGPSKNDNTGFLYGTCQPFFPIAWANEENRLYDVVELSYVAPDIPHWSDDSTVSPLLKKIKEFEGVAHFLFHQARIQKADEVKSAIRRVIKEVRETGYAIWTGKQINDWVRKRRAVKIESMTTNGMVNVSNPEDAKDVVAWIPVTEDQVELEDVEMKFGVPCKKVVVS